MIPKGKLLLIGGRENICTEQTEGNEPQKRQFQNLEIFRELLPKNKLSHRIEIITTSTGISEDVRLAYSEALEKVGFSYVGFINLFNKEETRKEEHQKRISESDAILFCGSDQFSIPTMIGGTKIENVILERFNGDENFIVTGFSAGAMAITGIIIWDGGFEETLMKKDLKTSAGLGLLKNCIVDTHLIQEKRFGRLAHAVIVNPAELGIGLGEDSALVITNGNLATCHGSGMVVIIDGKHITKTNIAEVKRGTPVFVENLKVHLLVNGCQFMLDERKLVPPVLSPDKNPDTKEILEQIFKNESGK